MKSTLKCSHCDPSGIAINSRKTSDFRGARPHGSTSRALDSALGFGATPAPFLRPVLDRRDEMEKHFVEFLSPGTFVSETTTKPVDTWDVESAVLMASEIMERHNSRPYGFRFLTRTRGPDDLDSKVSATSGIYYLGGAVFTREQVEERNLPGEEILRSNMRANDIAKIVVNTNSWKFTAPLRDGDTVLAFTAPACS